MFDHPPRGREWVSWLLLGLWSAAIFAVIPLARAIQKVVSELWGRQSFANLTLLVVLGAGGLAIRRLVRQRRPPASYVWLIAVGITFCVCTYQLRYAPEEALHFVQYGALGVLAYRALSHRVRDWTIYLTAATIGGMVGVIDEVIQWLVPGRFWGLQDIWIDLLGATLAQVGIAKGLRPAIISGPATGTGMRWLCRVGLAFLLLLALTVLNTPQRIAWYADRIPGLAFLKTNESVMLEYGHRFVDPEAGAFTSRLSRGELSRADRERGTSVAKILDRFRDHSRYREFLQTYTPVSDPFVHEARVHLFRRDRHLEWAEGTEDALYEPRFHLAVAFRENRIMEKYFPTTLRHSSYVLAPEKIALLRQNALPDQEMPGREAVSRVGYRLVTRISEWQIVALLVLTAVALAWLGRGAGLRESNRYRADVEPPRAEELPSASSGGDRRGRES